MDENRVDDGEDGNGVDDKIVIMIRIRMMRMLAMMVCGSTRDNDY